jgi:crotonobetainyl-CoA:carnitine CoA-transferase CaiB-like acyl-CoA transferase
MAQPLEGIRVVDLGDWIAGPLTTVVLSDLGAEVIRVDRPGRVETDADAFLQRGKRRITLDLKDPTDVETARALIDRSDVVVENFRPGVVDRLGVGAESFTESNPRLVYCSLPGFAADDPRRDVRAWEGVIAAATGNCRVRIGEAPADWDFTRPTYSAIPMASNFAAILAAFGIVSALVGRLRHGNGERIEVPLYHAMFELIGGAGAYAESQGFAQEKPLDKLGSGTYQCADGRWVQFNPIGASGRFLTWFLDAAGEPAGLAESFGFRALDRDDDNAGTGLHERLEQLFKQRSGAEWEALGNGAGVPICLIRTAAEWLECDQARESGAIVEVDDPVLGTTTVAGRIFGPLEEPTRRPARHLPDADRDEIMRIAAEPLPSTQSSTDSPGPPMEGLKVVDLTQILAGPSAGRMLAEAGAEVVKINAPQRNIEMHGLVNRGKRTMLLDLQSPAGQGVVHRLLSDADVFMQNFPAGTADRYGLGYEHVRSVRPEIAYVSVSCYGYGGPWASRRGYEVQGQAASGIMSRAGGDQKPGVLGPYNLLDYGTGAMAALAAAVAIYQQVATGQGQHTSTSLAQTGTFHQASMLLGHAGKRWTEPAGRSALGTGSLHRFFRASDGWFFLGAQDGEAPQVAALLDVEPGGSLDEFSEQLDALFAGRPAGHWVRLLVSGGVAAHEVISTAELMLDPYVVAKGLSIRQVSDEAGTVVLPGNPVRLFRSPMRVGYAARRPGSDAASILSDIGLEHRTDELERKWVLQLQDLPAGWAGS